MREPTVVVEGFAFPEALRWRNDQLWFSDILGGAVYRWSPDGGLHQVAPVESGPSGLGWTAMEELLVCDGGNRRILRFTLDGRREVHADLSHVMSHSANEMITDARGWALIGGYGYNPEVDEPTPSSLFWVSPQGGISEFIGGLIFPNGMAFLDGHTLVVAETFADRLSIIDVPSARVTSRIKLPIGATPDGLSVADDGTIWVASAYGEGVLRVHPDGAFERIIEVPGMGVYDVTFGPDRTVFVAVSDTDETHVAVTRPGKILSFRMPNE
jgi:sugar lactone lactonase YvrE